jgi:hypothetical protein
VILSETRARQAAAHSMQKRALVVVAGAVERGQQEHGNVGHGVLQARTSGFD